MSQPTVLLVPVHMLRDSAKLRSAAYLGSMVGVLLCSLRLARETHHPFLQNVHPIAFPGVLVLTDAFSRLRPADRTAWTTPISRQSLGALTQGMALGTTAILSVLGAAKVKGWVSAPAWGWEDGMEPRQVLASMAWTTANTVLVVFNEEQIFRGYGFATLQEALGTPGAVAVSVPLFALYHGRGSKRFLGLGAAGLFLTLLRLGTGNLWLAGGFHLAWNLGQQALFGPPDGPPSLRPLQLHGPPAWVGRPGHPDPGWLQILATALLVLLAGSWLRRVRAAEGTEHLRRAGSAACAPRARRG